MNSYSVQNVLILLESIKNTRLELKAAQITIESAKEHPLGILAYPELNQQAIDIAQRLLNLHAALNESNIDTVIEVLKKAA